jgi:trk system potassium uptake protein
VCETDRGRRCALALDTSSTVGEKRRGSAPIQPVASAETVNIFVIGAGQVGSTIVEALHGEHDLTVIDLDASRLAALSYRYDLATVEGNGASRRTLQDAGLSEADLLIACTSRDEVNIIAAIFAKGISPDTRTIVRTTNVEYLEVWRERQLDVDFIVSSELETAYAVSRIIGLPAARQTDVFADGQVQIVEFDVEAEADAPATVGPPLREARIPRDSKVASIIRGGQTIVPRGNESIHVGDRIIVIGSPDSAREWSALLAREKQRVDDVVIYGGGRTGTAVARLLLDQDIHVRLIEADLERARKVAADLPEARVFHATGIDPEFLERERIGQARAAIFAMRDDAKNHYAATLAKLHGVDFTIAIVHEAISMEVFERAGVDVAINPRSVTAEEIVRFAHDPRTQQVAMLEGDRYEVLDITVRPESKLVNRPFRELPITGSLIGAIVRNGTAIFPHGDDMLLPGDRVIVFTESIRVSQVERAL